MLGKTFGKNLALVDHQLLTGALVPAVTHVGRHGEALEPGDGGEQRSTRTQGVRVTLEPQS